MPDPAVKPLTIEDVATLLDTTQAAESRQSALQVVTKSAESKNADALYLLGVLYAWGREHPAAIVDVDLEQAERLLSNAAVLGVLDAIPRLTEVEIALKKPEAAAVWAATYLHYQLIAERDEYKGPTLGPPSNMGAAFGKFLFARTVAAVGDSYDAAATAADANALIERYGQNFEKYFGSAKLGSHLFSELNPDRKPAQFDMRHSAEPRFPDEAYKDDAPPIWRRWAIALLQPDGKQQALFFFDAYPAESVKYQVRFSGFRFEPANSDSARRIALISATWVNADAF
ncbi:SEL1-like repeat protein [Solimonas terrae]|uniref:SEL1-like repeat protein n=1 Tax=Solimonas terrae TaxID=1396819 RepID=A0A6M2BS57_9GAMM|nr:SEL1-like repeat protein [Solimonas terrae]NGY04933.1 SEL1-like repeat protein [Solimonas terrae]